MLATFQVKVVIVKCKSVKVKKWVQPVKGRLRHLLVIRTYGSSAVTRAFRLSISANASCNAAVSNGTSLDWSMP